MPRCKSRGNVGNHSLSKSDEDGVIVARPAKRKRASSMDEGMVITNQSMTLRIRSATPSKPDKKKLKDEREAEIMHQLDLTHNRRITQPLPHSSFDSPTEPIKLKESVLIPLQFSRPSPTTKPHPGSAAYFQSVEDGLINNSQSDGAMSRRHYLMWIAPRCDRCNFPRTGKKGWNKKTGCHTDLLCNDFRWRCIDMFC